MSGDFISRIISHELNIRAYAVSALHTAREIVRMQGCTPPAAIVLGRAVNAAALLSATLKPDSNQTISLKISGTGPTRELHVQADAKGNLRGYIANPLLETGNTGSDYAALIGPGLLTVVKDLGMKEPSSSVIPLLRGDIARDVAYYLTFSEQVPSALILSVMPGTDSTLAHSAGILIQTFPDTKDDTIAGIEKNIIDAGHSLTGHLSGGGDIYGYLSALLGDAPFTVMQITPLRAACRCNRDMLARVLQSFSEDELRDMISRDDGAEISCYFCKTNYRFTSRDMGDILSRKKE